MKRYNVLANRYNDGYEHGRRVRGRRKRVRVQRVFSKKKLTGPSQTRTRLPVYPPIPGHGYRYHGYRTRIHGYGLYPAGFSKPLPTPIPIPTLSWEVRGEVWGVKFMTVSNQKWKPLKVLKSLHRTIVNWNETSCQVMITHWEIYIHLLWISSVLIVTLWEMRIWVPKSINKRI
jgi:hypothetical protein